MRLLIVSGRSGSGKTISLQALEDLGYYCVDNLPVPMLPELVSQLSTVHPKLAVSIDARNLPKDVHELKEVITKLKTSEQQCQILYLDAEDKTLLARFSETRRRHPLTRDGISLQEAILQEQHLLSPLANMADISIDSTSLSKPQLCGLILEKVATGPNDQLQLLLHSFGFKHGLLPDADFIFDVRCLPNPYWVPELRNQTGLDDAVADYLAAKPEVTKMIDDIGTFLTDWLPRFKANHRSYLTVGIGCTGGQHRSVYIAQQLLKWIEAHHKISQIRHRDIPPTS